MQRKGKATSSIEGFKPRQWAFSSLPGGQAQTGGPGLFRPEGSCPNPDGGGEQRKGVSPRPPACAARNLPADANRRVT